MMTVVYRVAVHFRALLSLGVVGFALNHFDHGHHPMAHPDETQEQKGPSGIVIPNFKPTEFPFVIINVDDGKDPSGGWQEAKVNLEFDRIIFPIKYIKWYCPFTIGMPIRHHTRGIISPLTAATMSAAVANAVVAAGMNYDLPQGIFCTEFRKGVETTFPMMHPGLGERVTK